MFFRHRNEAEQRAHDLEEARLSGTYRRPYKNIWTLVIYSVLIFEGLWGLCLWAIGAGHWYLGDGPTSATVGGALGLIGLHMGVARRFGADSEVDDQEAAAKWMPNLLFATGVAMVETLQLIAMAGVALHMERMAKIDDAIFASLIGGAWLAAGMIVGMAVELAPRARPSENKIEG